MATLNHGTVRGYKGGCRCDLCKDANTQARRRERQRKRERLGLPVEGVPAPTESAPTRRRPAPTATRRSVAADELVRVIEEAIFDNRGALAAATAAAEQLRELGYRKVEDGPIEAQARAALATVGGDGPVVALRREVAYRAAAVMDNPKAVPFFKSAADALRAEVADLLAAAPPKDGEADVLNGLLDSFGAKRGARRGAPVDDAEESE